MNSILLSCALALFVATVTLAAPMQEKQPWQKLLESKVGQLNYLRKFGYLVGSKASESDEDFVNSLKKLQRDAQLPETGVVDKATLEIMQTPRCGMLDDDDEHRQKRYVLYPQKWSNTDFTYSFLNYSSKVTKEEARETIAKALKLWTDASVLTFKEGSKSSTLKIGFKRLVHGDLADFDGPGGILAHGFYPHSGVLHFDEDENWTVDSPQGFNMLAVAAHELGHVVGMKHSDNKEAVMWKWYKSYDPNFHLDEDDIEGIQALYGKP